MEGGGKASSGALTALLSFCQRNDDDERDEKAFMLLIKNYD